MVGTLATILGQLWPAALLAVFLLQTPNPALGHGAASWIMQNDVTRHCCGPQDCRPLTLAGDQVTTKDGDWYVNGRKVFAHYVYPARGHFEYWACFYSPDYVVPRCLFVPGAS